MSPDENNERLIHETQSTIEFIKGNWTDEIGKQYIYWLEQSLEKIKQLERRRELIRLKINKINLLCEKITSTEDDSPKILKKTR